MYVNKLLIIITAILLTCTSLAVKALAIKADSKQENVTVKVNSKQLDKKKAYDSTVRGGYLKPQLKK